MAPLDCPDAYGPWGRGPTAESQPLLCEESKQETGNAAPSLPSQPTLEDSPQAGSSLQSDGAQTKAGSNAVSEWRAQCSLMRAWYWLSVVGMFLNWPGSLDPKVLLAIAFLILPAYLGWSASRQYFRSRKAGAALEEAAELAQIVKVVFWQASVAATLSILTIFFQIMALIAACAALLGFDESQISKKLAKGKDQAFQSKVVLFGILCIQMPWNIAFTTVASIIAHRARKVQVLMDLYRSGSLLV